MNIEFADSVGRLVRKAPLGWLISTCEIIRELPAGATNEFVMKRVPITNNADICSLLLEVLKLASGKLSWNALSWVLHTAAVISDEQHNSHRIELLWSGPSPGYHIRARRIDQVLYDLIAQATQEIHLITFAATKIDRLAASLMAAAARGVKIRLILEFEQSSEGQLSYDAAKAFSPDLLRSVQVFYWPLEMRERNSAGRPGKLHAKAAIVDGIVLISSANLTDDAFNRNLELGVACYDRKLENELRNYLDHLIASGSLVRWR